MDFGIPTLVEHKDLAESVSLCRELNLKFIERNMNLPAYQAESLADTEVFRRVREKQAFISPSIWTKT